MRLLRRLRETGLSFQDVAVSFFNHHPMSAETRRNYRASLGRWHPFVGHLGVCQIGRLHLQRFVNARLAAGAGTPAIRQDLAFLSSLISHAQLLPGGPEVNVVRHYPKRHLAPARSRERFLTDAEVAALLGQLDGIRRLIVELALATGMRMGEVLRLRRSELHLEDHHILLPAWRTKTRKPRQIPLLEAMCARLSAHLATLPAGVEWVLPNRRTWRPYRDASPWFPKAAKAAGLADVRFHDLRHTFASRWVQRGGSERVLQEILGHRSMGMTRRYTHLTGEHLRAELLRVVEETAREAPRTGR